MAAKFEYYADKSGKFRFRLKAANGQIIATSEAYESKSSCMNGIESVVRAERRESVPREQSPTRSPTKTSPTSATIA